MSRPGEPPTLPRLLVLRALGLGDLLAAVPAIAGLRRRFPGFRLVLAAPAAIGRFLSAAGLVDEVLPAGPLEPLDGPASGADLAVNLHGSGPESIRLLMAARPRTLLTYRHPAVPEVAGPLWDGDEHETQRWMRLVRTVGAEPALSDLRLPGAQDVPVSDGPVVVHPGAAYGVRRWPADRYAAVARELSRSGREVLVTGGPSEVPLAAEVAGRAGLPDTSVLAGSLPLADLADLLRRASLLVVGDTGVAHLATACGTRSVRLFGPEPPSRWGPLIDRDRAILIWHGEGRRDAPDPRSDEPDPALLAITVPEVLEAGRALLQQSAR